MSTTTLTLSQRRTIRTAANSPIQNVRIEVVPASQAAPEFVDAKGLPSVQEQIDRYNRAIEIMRNTRPDSPMYQDCLAEVRAIRGEGK